MGHGLNLQELWDKYQKAVTRWKKSTTNSEERWTYEAMSRAYRSWDSASRSIRDNPCSSVAKEMRRQSGATTARKEFGLKVGSVWPELA